MHRYLVFRYLAEFGSGDTFRVYGRITEAVIALVTVRMIRRRMTDAPA